MSSNINIYKITNFINNQLECFFFFNFFKNTSITFPNQNLKHSKTQNESQHSQNPQRPTSTSKRKLPSLNKKCKPHSLVIAYLYGLDTNSTAMLELCRCRWKVEGKH